MRLKMLHFTAVFYFFQFVRPVTKIMYVYTSKIFLPKTRSNLRETTGDVYIRLKKFISTTTDVYTRLLNKVLLGELVAELKTMWLLT